MRKSWSSRKPPTRSGRGSPPHGWRKWRLLLVPAVCAGLVVAFQPTAGASAAPKAFGRVDHPTQTTGIAVRYGTSAPLPRTAAAASPRASSTAKDSGVARPFSRDPQMNKAAKLQPPSPPGTPVVRNPGAATGFNGLSHADQRLAGTGIYTNTQFSLEPPDQGLCVGNGFVVEPINTAFAVYNERGTQLTAATALNQFYKRSPLIDRTTNTLGDFLSDPKCYWDPAGHRFIQTILEMDAPGPSNVFPFFQRSHVLVAVSRTSNPTGAWNLYSIDTSDDGLNGTPSHTQCPCLPDQPLLGANRDGVFISTNEFQNNAQFFFNGGQIYGLGRAALESGASSVVFTHLDVGTVPTRDPNLPRWGSIQPSVSVNPRSGTELLMTGGPEDQFQNNAPLDNRIAAWSLTGTGSLKGGHPRLQLSHVVLHSETYGLPINTGATQKFGPTPLRDALNSPPINATEAFEKINANDSRMNQVVDLNGVLFGGVNTTVTSRTGPPRVGIAYFAVGAAGTPFGIFARIIHQGYVAVNGENVLFPSIAVNRAGVGAMAFTLSGPHFFPSAAYVRFGLGRAVGPIHVSGPGVLPEDGFTGYKSFQSPTPGVARWGDYSAAVFADGAIWMGNEFIPGTPRTQLANWGTFLSRLRA
jgi:hypothetical protein